MRFIFSSTLATAVLFVSSVVADTANTQLSGDQQRALDIHNQARASRGLPQLYWDYNLARAAQDWANNLRNIGGLQHGSAGENLYWQSWWSDAPFAPAVEFWLSEEPNYHGETIPDGDFSSYGHYTQCMWRDTQRVGMAAADDGKGGLYVVARYDPIGNYEGQRPF